VYAGHKSTASYPVGFIMVEAGECPDGWYTPAAQRDGITRHSDRVDSVKVAVIASFDPIPEGVQVAAAPAPVAALASTIVSGAGAPVRTPDTAAVAAAFGRSGSGGGGVVGDVPVKYTMVSAMPAPASAIPVPLTRSQSSDAYAGHRNPGGGSVDGVSAGSVRSATDGSMPRTSSAAPAPAGHYQVPLSLLSTVASSAATALSVAGARQPAGGAGANPTPAVQAQMEQVASGGGKEEDGDTASSAAESVPAPAAADQQQQHHDGQSQQQDDGHQEQHQGGREAKAGDVDEPVRGATGEARRVGGLRFLLDGNLRFHSAAFTPMRSRWLTSCTRTRTRCTDWCVHNYHPSRCGTRACWVSSQC